MKRVLYRMRIASKVLFKGYPQIDLHYRQTLTDSKDLLITTTFDYPGVIAWHYKDRPATEYSSNGTFTIKQPVRHAFHIGDPSC